MNLFRREDMGYTNLQPSDVRQGSQAGMLSHSEQPYSRQQQPNTTHPSMSLPGYPACGPLPQNGAAMCLNRAQQQQQGAGLPAGLLVSEKVSFSSIRITHLHWLPLGSCARSFRSSGSISLGNQGYLGIK